LVRQGLVSPGACNHATPVRREASSVRVEKHLETRRMNYADFHRRSLEDRDAFWAEQAQLIDWQAPFTTTATRRSHAGSSVARPTCATTRSTAMPPRTRTATR
jgi:hypothetical protein